MSDAAMAYFREVDNFDVPTLSAILEKVKMLLAKKKENPVLPANEKLALFEKFKGCMKVEADFDAKKEYLDYLDERYGV